MNFREMKLFTRKYFATSHGNEVEDGIGGRAKSLVRTAVMSKKKNARHAEDLYKIVQVFLIPAGTIPQHVWNEACPLKGIHIMKTTPNLKLALYRNTKAIEDDVVESAIKCPFMAI